MSKESIILSLRELIDAAFGDYDKNTVNFNLVKTVMFILARQLRLLERHVEVDSNKSVIDLSIDRKSSNLSVTEVKIQAKVASKKVKKNRETTKSIKNKGKVGKTKSSGKTVSGTFGLKYDETESDDESTDEISNASKVLIETKTPHDKLQKKGGLKTIEKSKKSTGSKIQMIKENDEIAKIERLLRIINQRSDSLEEGHDNPTPMSSPIASEKILIVKTKNQEDRDKKISKTSPIISVVTKDQFDALVKDVNLLRESHNTLTSEDIPETKTLMKQLKEGASLSESIVALQLSARLEAAEKALERMIELVTYLAQHINTGAADEVIEESQSKSQAVEEAVTEITKEEAKKTEGERRLTLTDTTKTTMDRITYAELNEIIQELKINIEKSVETIMAKNKTIAENALQICKDLDDKLSQAILVEMRMGHLEHMVDEYTQKINILDTSLSSQMTHYQELLTQMEHDLEAGIENMAEALANAGGDTTAISELNSHFSSLALDFDNMAAAQRELRDNEQIFTMDIQELWHQVEYLKEAKSDRDEVEDALRDKVGLDSLNGVTTMIQFEAVRGDLEKRIRSAFEKFNSQEFAWQKVIDDFIRELNEKAHNIQLESLRDDMNKHLNFLRDRIEFIANIVGEPRAAGTTRMVYRDTACVSCSMPAHISEEQSDVPVQPALPNRRKTPAIADEAEGAGDFIPCIPGKHIPHPDDDIRSKICTRFCGGKHTKVIFPPPTPEKAVLVSHIPRETSLETYDNKQQHMSESATVPCLPCNYYPEEQIKEPCACGKVCKCFLSSPKEDTSQSM